MTDRDPLHHLADRARRGVLLPAEGALLADAVTELEKRAACHERVAQSAARDAATALTAQLTAEAAIERVRKLATQWAVLRAYGGAAYELRKALDENPGERAPLVHVDTEQQANDAAGVDEPALDQPQQPTV